MDVSAIDLAASPGAEAPREAGVADVPVIADAVDARLGADGSVDADLSFGSCTGAPPGPTCDPVCQTGCNGGRCNLVGPSPTCSLPSAPGRAVGAECIYRPTDSCQAGLICLEEARPVCGAHCYRFCRHDSDCAGGAHCSVALTFDSSTLPQFVCDVPPTTCVPFKGHTACGNAEGFGCYVEGSRFPDRVVCDCAGTVEEDEECNVERGQCKPGLICVNGGGGDAAKCHAVCPLDDAASSKQICGTKTCVPYADSTKFGFCR